MVEIEESTVTTLIGGIIGFAGIAFTTAQPFGLGATAFWGGIAGMVLGFGMITVRQAVKLKFGK